MNLWFWSDQVRPCNYFLKNVKRSRRNCRDEPFGFPFGISLLGISAFQYTVEDVLEEVENVK